MKNAKHLLLMLLASVSLGSQLRADSCNTSCDTSCNTSCFTGCNTDCNTDCGKSSCNDGRRFGFSVRPITSDPVLELGLWNYYVYHDGAEAIDNCVTTDWQVAYFHRTSSRRCKGNGLWPNGTNTIVVDESGAGDINSLWLGLGTNPGNFNATVTIRPGYKLDGAYLGTRWNLDNWACGLYASAFLAVARLKNNTVICETGSTSNACPDQFTTVSGALNFLTNGEFDPCNTRRGRTHVDDVQVKFGWDYYMCDGESHAGLYLVGLIPTRRKFRENCDSDLFFDGRLGSSHGSIGLGINTDWTFWACEDSAWNWMMDAKYLRASNTCERRQFDLTNGPLTRFLQVVTADTTMSPTSAFPFLNRDVRVKGRSTFDFWTALHWQVCNLGLELGYDLFWRQRERICLLGDISTLGIGIFDISGCGSNFTASTADINSTPSGANAVVSDTVFTPITNANLDLGSAAHRRVLSQKVYGALSLNADLCNSCPAMVGIGAEYEIARRCDPALNHWGVFVKAVLSF